MEPIKDQTEQDAPNFLGFYSAIIDGTLISLMNASTPGLPEYEQYARGTERLDTLDMLEKENIDAENTEVEEIIGKLISAGKPFGLYLRNFDLGARKHSTNRTVFNIPQIATTINAADNEMQHLLNRAFPGSTFVAISNPAYHTAIIPQVILSDDQWLNTAENFIKHAGFIVMFFLTASAGVSDEIALLRAADVQKRTVIVIAGDDPRNSRLEKSMLTFVGEPGEALTNEQDRSAASLHSMLPDFPNIIQLGTTGAQDAFVDFMQGIIQAAEQTVNLHKFAIPPRPKPSAELLHYAHNGALNEFDNAKRLYAAGDGRSAEDACIRSIVFNYWAWDRLGRSLAFLELGHTERYLLKDDKHAVDCYFKALGLMVSIKEVSPTAKESYKILAAGLAEYLKSLGNLSLAQSVRDKYMCAT